MLTNLLLAAAAVALDQVPPQYVFPAQEQRQNGTADFVALATGDLDGDGLDDVVSTGAKARLRAWRGQALGGLVAAGSLVIDAPAVALDLGDVNGDGVLDVVFTTGPKVFAALGDGGSGFAPAILLGFVNEGVAVVAEDLDGDGDDDVSVLSRANGKLKCWLADGTGGFSSPVMSALAQGPRDFALADLDGDGLLDAAIADAAAGRVVIARGAGDGSFASIGMYPTPPVSPTAIALGDLDQDGIVDLATAGEFGPYMQQRSGQGDGSFGPLVTCDFGVDIELVDWDGDGRLDRITRSGLGPVWLPYAGVCGLGQPLRLPISKTCTSFAVLDSNGDGYPDLAFGAASEFDELNDVGDAFTSVGVVEGDGKGGFLGVRGVEKDPGLAAKLGGIVDDFDLDGIADLLQLGMPVDSLILRLGSGFVSLGEPQVVPIPGVSAVLLADLDGDGDPDVVSRGSQGLHSVINRTGVLADAVHVAPDQNAGYWATGDLDGDGFEDLVLLSYQVGTYARLSRGNGLFTQPIPSPDVPYPTWAGGSVHVADLNGDAFGDLVVGGAWNGISTYLGIGDGRFVPAQFFAPELEWAGLVVGDLNGDGLDDVALAKSDLYFTLQANLIQTFLSDGSGGLAAYDEYEIGRSMQQVRMHDLNLDGALDLVAQLAQNVVAVAHGDGLGGFSKSERYGTSGYVLGFGRTAPKATPDMLVLPIDALATRFEALIVLQR